MGWVEDKVTGCNYYTSNPNNRLVKWTGGCDESGRISGEGTLEIYQYDFDVSEYLHYQTYIGEIQAGQCHGDGTFFWKDGSKYEGQWQNGLAHGQ